MRVDADTRPLRNMRYVTPRYRALLAVGMLLTNQASFWRGSVQEQVGLLDKMLRCAFEYDWFFAVNQRGQGCARQAHLGRAQTAQRG